MSSSSSAISSSFEEVMIGPDLNSTRSPLDKKLYRHITLPNGLCAVLISDTVALSQKHLYEYDSEDEEDENLEDELEDEKKGDDEEEGDDDDEEEYEEEGLRMAAAALVVGAGSYHDPVHAQGMAHFLEHMLFMGTKKYPTENAYDAFLSSNGGSDNAFTEYEYTLYHFDIPQENLFPALDMFAQFFVDPLLLEEAMERELQSIESEFQLSKNSDECRVHQLMTHCIREGGKELKHPFGKFSWGNLHSLKAIPEKNKVDMVSELRQFYNRHYHASNMRLVLIGAYTLDELQSQVLQSFSAIPPSPRTPQPSSTQPPISSHGMPFPPTSLSRLYRIIPVRERHTLNITWQLPPQTSNWRTKPCDYIAHLLGHEGRGSLLTELRSRCWGTGCCAGVGEEGDENATSHSLFTMSFSLSEEGVTYWDEIVDLVYRYVGMMRFYCREEGGLPDWIFEELRVIRDVGFKYEEEGDLAECVEEIAEGMVPGMELPEGRLLDGHKLLFDFDENQIQNLIDEYFVPSNAIIDLMSSTFGRDSDYDDVQDLPFDLSTSTHRDDEGDAQSFSVDTAPSPQIEPMFGTKYWCHVIPPLLLQKWTDSSSPTLPPPTSNLTLPPQNPFLPTRFDLKPVPPEDSNHPLLSCSLKLCISIGKTKAWFPATVTRYNSTNDLLLLSYEDEDQKWHKLDTPISSLQPSLEGTFDDTSIKFKLVSIPRNGQNPVLKFGDETDFDVEDNLHFPPIPPPLPETRLPHLIVNTSGLKIWHLQDRKFNRPHAEFRMKITCLNNQSPLHRAISDLFLLLVQDAITETVYQASVCELGSELQCTDVGFVIRVHGFDHQLLVLLEEVLRVFLSFRSRELPEEVKEGRFEACLEVLERRYKNTGLAAGKLCSDVRLRCLRPTIWSTGAKLNAIKDISIPTFCSTISTILSKLSIESLYHGNCSPQDVQTAKRFISSSLASSLLPKKKHPTQPVIKTPLAISQHPLLIPTKDPNEPNTAIEVYFQIGKDDIKQRVLIDLLAHMLYEPLYDQLRTKEQFGYQVGCGARWTYGVMGMSFQVVTAQKSASEVDRRIDRFLYEYRNTLSNMSDSIFLSNLIGLAKNKLQMYNSLEEECNALWGEIFDRRYEFEVHRLEALELRNVRKDDVLRVYDEWLMPKCEMRRVNKKRRRLVVYVIGSSEGSASEGRPVVEEGCCLEEAIDERVKGFHRVAKNETWGKIL